MLFALYISELGRDVSSSTLGYKVGDLLTVSCLLFADDIVLVSKTCAGFKHLVRLVKYHCDRLKLDISVEKSQVVSPEDVEAWEFQDEDGETILSLKSVLSYKYLGVYTSLTMSSTGSKKQKKAHSDT